MNNRAAWGLWSVGLIAMTVGALLPQLAPPGAFGLDKLAHFGGYAAMTLLPAVLLRRRGALWLAAAVMLAFGGGIELAQGLVPGRESSLGDLLANAVGILAGIGAGLVLVRPRAQFRVPA